MEFLIDRVSDRRFLIEITEEAQPGTQIAESGVAVKVTNRWKPESKIYPTFIHFNKLGLKVGESESENGVKCTRLEDF